MKLSAISASGEPHYSNRSETRIVYFPEGGSVLFPLLMANAQDMEAFKQYEVMFRIGSTLNTGRAAAGYGTLTVVSDIDQAEIRLDGGLVGKTSKATSTILENVLEGIHEVSIRTSGRSFYRTVTVERDRAAMILIGDARPKAMAPPGRLAAPLGKNAQGYQEYRREADDAVVVKIPGGEFLMGNRETEREPLEHTVEVAEFTLDKTSVTWHQFKKFAAATGASLPPNPPYWGIHDDHPAVFVTWEEAKAYCEWAGGRLPTEAERELGARGTDHRKYPWGNDAPTPQRAVFRRNWGGVATDPVNAHPTGASPFGLLDMGGNVWEWVADWYDEKYYEVSPRFDPRGPRTGAARVVRGGSWDSRPSVLSASCRNFGYRNYREGDFGFRCAMDAPE
jgi:formylglycine-generating enzyme required for sulfatase activity